MVVFVVCFALLCFPACLFAWLCLVWVNKLLEVLVLVCINKVGFDFLFLLDISDRKRFIILWFLAT